MPKLISQLFESEIFISIGSQHFQVNRDLFQAPGNSPNYFTLGFAVFFANPTEVFPGLNREGLLRPPSIQPAEVPNRSAEVFAELLHLLRGYPVRIRSEDHRQALLRDCRYFHFKGLEQKLIPHTISWNPCRGKQEIVIRLEDIRPSGISFVSDHPAAQAQAQASTATPSPSNNPTAPVSSSSSPALHSPAAATASAGAGSTTASGPAYTSGWINYARPFVDEHPRELIIECSGETTWIDWRQSRAIFSGTTNQRISALLQVITNKLGLPVSHEYPMGLKMMSERMNGGSAASSGGPTSPGLTPLSEDRVKIRIGPECYLDLDGEEVWDREGIPVTDIEPLPSGYQNPYPYPHPYQQQQRQQQQHQHQHQHQHHQQQQQQQHYQQPHYQQPHDLANDSFVVSPNPGGGGAGGGSGAGNSPGIPWPVQTAPMSQPLPVKPPHAASPSSSQPPRKRLKRTRSSDDRGGPERGGSSNFWAVKRAQWRLRIQTVHHPPNPHHHQGGSGSGGADGLIGMDGRADGRPVKLEAVLVGVKIEAFSGEYGRNCKRAFLV